MVAWVPAGTVRQMMRVLDLFSGIGGFSLGLERTGGFRTVAFCEIEEFPRRVLASHWPGVPIYHDVRELSRVRLAADGLADVDVICGGFPCQDISFAGKRAGLEGARSGLWGEYQRLVGELRPRFVIVENVPGLLSLGMGTVCGDLAALGYDAVWDCVPAAAVGAPHRRDRVWIVAHAHGQGEHARPLHAEMGGAPEYMADADGGNGHGRGGALQMGWQRGTGETEDDGFARGNEWSVEPDVGRVAHGVPARVDRLKGLGNAVVPQIPELIGNAIIRSLA
jgi:DNA (cytosine-5)-methyltransferase 1